MVLNTMALIIHVIICCALGLMIQAESSKGGGFDANLGGAAMNVFGGSVASKFLKKWTQILCVLFILSCIFMAIQGNKAATGKAKAKVYDEKFVDTQQPAPAPAPAPAPQPAPSPAPAAA